MIAFLVLATLMVELAIYAVVGDWLWRACGVPFAALPLLGVAAFLALRIALVALACALARRWAAAASAPLGAAGFLRLVASETRAFLQAFVFGQVLQHWLAPRDPERIVPGVTPDKWARVWRERHPDIALELIPVEETQQRAVLDDGTADLTLARLPVDRERLSAGGEDVETWARLQ